MAPKFPINQAKHRRELQRRTQFVQERMKVAPIELSYALGKIPRFPNGMRLPPPWALEAARESWRLSFANFAELEREVMAKKVEPSAKTWELFAIYRSMVGFLESPAADLLDEEKSLPALKSLRKSARRQISKGFLKHINRLEREFRCRIPAPSHAELIAHAEGASKGVVGMFTKGRELSTIKTATAKINHVLWYFWPEFGATLSGPMVHVWLAQEQGLKTSDKMVERILTKLRKAT